MCADIDADGVRKLRERLFGKLTLADILNIGVGSLQVPIDSLRFSTPNDRTRLAQKHVHNTHLRGMTSNPVAVSERLTICMVQRPIFSRAPRSFGPP